MTSFTNLKTRSKLTAGFGLIIALLLVIVITAWLALRAMHETQRGVTDALALRNNLDGQRTAMLGALLAPSPEVGAARLKDATAYAAESAELLKHLDALYSFDAELQPLVAQIVALHAEYMDIREREIMPLMRERKNAEAAASVLGSQMDRHEKFRQLTRDFTNRLTERSEARLAQARTAFILLGATALLAAIVMIASFGRLLADPLEHLTTAAAKISEGDLDFEFADVKRTDEVGVLMQTFQRMRRSLNILAGRARQIADGDLTPQIKPRSERDVLGNAFADMVTELRRIMQELLGAVNVVASSASEIMASTTQLAATAAETATAVAQTTATVEEVKQTSQVSSQKAKFVSDQAQKVTEISLRGKRAVGQTLEGMTDIRRQMGAVAESILSLSAQGQAIGEIIATVDDLAAQSKLLAVNASIEAAKAGEEGKGFSVVAQEVRALAEQSKQATTQVRSILNDIQKATGSAVLATEQATKTVENGVQQSTAAGESIGALTDNVSQAAQAATQIAATSQEQFVGMDQVALAMENIKQASTQSVASTHQAETAAQQLHEFGQKLKQLVERFKV